MSYHVVDPDDLDAVADRPCDLRSVGGAVGLENVAVNVFDASPGEQLPLAYHYHDEQEELFFVATGTIRIETPDEEFAVGEGQFFVAEPGNPHRAFVPADGDADARVIAVGAPSVDDVHRYEP